MARTVTRKAETLDKVLANGVKHYGNHKAYAEAMLAAEPSLKFNGSGKGIAQRRSLTHKSPVLAKPGALRWEWIAVFGDLGVAETKKRYEQETGTPAAESYSGRGRNFGDSPAPTKPAPAKAKPAAKRSTKPAAKRSAAVKPTVKRTVKRGSAEGNA